MRAIVTLSLVAVLAVACGGQVTETTGAETTATTAAPTTTASPATTASPTTTPSTITTGGEGGDVVDVFAEDFAFNPSMVTIKVGDSVRWNLSSGSHTTTSGTGTPDGRWNQAIAEEAPVVVTFSEAGEFPYYCRFHPDFMSGTVVVEP